MRIYTEDWLGNKFRELPLIAPDLIEGFSPPSELRNPESSDVRFRPVVS